MKPFPILICLLIAALVLPSPALAKKDSGSATMTLVGGGFSFDSDLDTETGLLYGLKLGYDITGSGIADSLGLEAVLNGVSAESSQTGDDASAWLFRIDAIYPLLSKGRIIPFLSVGIGGIFLDSDPDSEESAIVAYGLGTKYFLEDYLALRADFRHLIWVDADAFGNYEYTVGLTYLFGKERKKKAAGPPDADKDGVPDSKDRCPDTPRGIAVQKNGCPLDGDEDGVPDHTDKCPDTLKGIRVDIAGCPVDSDLDGVPDTLDKCTNTPEGVTVDEYGCSLDSDKDGVPDSLDKCPDTPSETGVDRNGCPAPDAATSGSSAKAVGEKRQRVKKAEPAEEQGTTSPEKSVTEERIESAPIASLPSTLYATIQFHFGFTDIQQEQMTVLDEVVEAMQASPGSTAVIEGHTDDSGMEKNNLEISRVRAENVQKHLVEAGVDPSRLTTRGLGSSKPIADNSTPEGREKNRRVVVIITTNE